MRYIADLHIHSPFSRATSKAGNLQGLAAWARVKGIHLLGTGDFTHPGWFSQLKEQLEPAEPGFFKLKNEAIPPALVQATPEALPSRFLLTAEISSIYKRHGAVRKVHNLLYVPDFASAERINSVLAGIGNIESDGRPILGLDSRDLLEILLEKAPEGFLVPAHIWTPWFSLFGSRSGFNTIEECYGDLSPHVFALETGLSSDPDMNRLIPALDRFALISNSDCHSPGKLGREANIFNTGFSFSDLREALKNPLTGGFAATIEFYPEEGKYHCDGHRNCQVCLEPVETRKIGAICPVCGKPLTVGVLHRVMELAERTEPYYPPGSPAVHSLIPLPEVLGEILGAGPATKGVMALYSRVIARFGSEFNLLLNTPGEEINLMSPVLGEAVARIRTGKVIRTPGYDGEFGVIRVFAKGEREELAGQINLFTGKKAKHPAAKKERTPLPPTEKPSSARETPLLPRKPNPEQLAAITNRAANILVAAGPGTGKTFTLVARIEHLLTKEHARPEEMVAITFTNRAASEMRARLERDLGEGARPIFVGTFHAYCLSLLRKETPDLVVVGEEERDFYLRKSFPDFSRAEHHILKKQLAGYVDQMNRGILPADAELPDLLARYLPSWIPNKAIDLDLVIPCCVERFRNDPDFAAEVTGRVTHLFVDEFQDLNHPQYQLVLLLGKQARVFAIGDPNQAIYGFRGSDLTLFQRFRERAGVTTLPLIRNYRSAPAIIDGAAALIRRNQQSGDTQLLAESTSPSRIEWHQAPTAQAEAEFIAHRIEEGLGGTSNLSRHTARSANQAQARSFADFAVLYRLSQMAEPIAEALHHKGIPFQLVGGTPFFLKPGLKAATHFLLASAPDATLNEHLQLLADLPGIGEATLSLLEQKLPLRCHDFPGAAATLPLPANTARIIRETGGTLTNFRKAAQQGITDSLSEALPRMGFGNPQDLEVKRLLQLANAFGNDLQAFCDHLRQNAQATIYDERAEGVALMSMHAAKGLEFPVVFLAGLEEDILPCTIANRHSDVEEERRLLYVAMTRAQESLILSGALNRTIFNRTSSHRPSRFIQEIPASLVLEVDHPRHKRRNAGGRQMQLF
ncbi:UvrD-helicase domain-containing protein [Thiovibrio frasassiensis]|uniref:DNA 3'-5' helicase n=1 Tax=Thiovibrio frasassiensis TaxID=2984131 RepID=A0A9X4MI88_9BACT|nr:UvrD-helicase domain-containing protein [Thiovibrio frasassiensis]MDG4476023.1 UvrD-helicase domain-containing protein [Thiovibrio frasassiensis]